MTDAAKPVALIALAAIVACGGAGESDPAFHVRGTGIVIQSDASFTRRSDFPARVESTIEAGLRYWGGSWSHLDGRTVTFVGDRYVACRGSPSAIGCYDGNIRVSTRDPGFIFYCVEETVLVHEIGHAVIGDPDHVDPRWSDFEGVARELAGRPGYAGPDEVPCHIFVSVWQHPPPHP